MPTKPSFGSFEWATDTNYTTGPALLIGTPTKVTPPAADSNEGWKADQAPPAQWTNFYLNLITGWTEWVRQGDNTGALEEPYIVEADSLGRVSAVRFLATNPTIAGTAIDVAAGEVGNSDGVDVKRDNNGDCYVGVMNGDGRCYYAASGSTVDPAIFVDVTTGTANGIEVTTAANANCIDATAQGALGIAGRFECDDGAAINALVTGPNTSPTIVVTGNAAPQRANLFMSNQVTPSLTFAGDVSIEHGSNGFGRGRMRVGVNDGSDGGGATAHQTLWSTLNGNAHGYDDNGAHGGNPITTFQQVAQAILDGGQASPGKPDGIYFVWWMVEVDCSNAGDTVAVELRDGAVTVLHQDVRTVPNNGSNMVMSGFTIGTIAGATIIDYRLFVSRTTGSGVINVVASKIGFLGAFELGF